MDNGRLPVKWLYIFAVVAVLAFGTCMASLYFKEYFIAICTGLVFGAQIINIVKWKK